MNEDSNADAKEGTSEDIESLLSVPVNKDYINCVWTHDDPSPSNKPVDMESSPRKLVIASPSASSDQENEEVSDSNEGSSETDRSKPAISAVNCQEKQMSQKTLEVIPSLSPSSNHKSVTNGAQTTDVSPISLGRSCKADEDSERFLQRRKKKKSVKEKVKVKDRNSPKKTPFKAKDKQEGMKQIHATMTQSHVSSKSEGTKPETVRSNDAKKQSRSNINRNGKSVKTFKKSGSLNHKIVEAMGDPSTAKYLSLASKSLLVQQPLPPYSPKHLDTRYFSGHLHICRACEDKFVLQSSLLAHMSRKTVKFSFKCPVCKARVNFDNRCSLILHIKSHKMKVESINQEELCILPLTRDEDECNGIFQHVSVNSQKCPECSKVVVSRGSHLQKQEGSVKPLGSSNRISSLLECKECCYVLPTPCAFAAHERYHKGTPPYVCPECGDMFLTSSSLSSHMNENCLHSQKRTLFCCGLCKIYVTSMELFTEHLTSLHLRQVYECHVCRAFVGTFEELNTHRAEKHKLPRVKSLSGIATQHAQVECDNCPGLALSVEPSASSLQDHAASHTLDPQVLTTVYTCRGCICMFETKKSFYSHKAACQGNTDSTSNIEGGIYELHGDVFSCFQHATPSQIVSSDQTLQAPVEATVSSSGMSSVGNNISKRHNQSRIVSSDDGQKHSQDIISGDTGASSELSGHVDSKQNFRTCRLCKETISVGNDRAALKKHFASKHFSIFMKAVYDKGSAQLPNLNVSSRSAETPRDKRNLAEFFKSLQIDYRSLNGADEGDWKIVMSRKKNKASKFANKLPGKVLGKKLHETKNGFSCYKCSFTSKDVETFKSHIISHKSNPSDLQCPQCGLCFIVRPPLEKHLIVEHGIKNVENYLVNHGFKDDLSDEEEDESVNIEEPEPEELLENQCKVCKKVFESTILLEKHFRVHGGAFLLANMKAKKSGLSQVIN